MERSQAATADVHPVRSGLLLTLSVIALSAPRVAMAQGSVCIVGDEIPAAAIVLPADSADDERLDFPRHPSCRNRPERAEMRRGSRRSKCDEVSLRKHIVDCDVEVWEGFRVPRDVLLQGFESIDGTHVVVPDEAFSEYVWNGCEILLVPNLQGIA